MADFRKYIFAFALVALMLGAGASANAQGTINAPAFSCNANAGVPPIVRSEGVTELVGDLILNCTNGQPTAAGQPIPLSNVQIFLNTNVTSRLLNSSNLSEATMLIDEPYPTSTAGGTPTGAGASQIAGSPNGQFACQANNATGLNNCAMNGVYVAGGPVPVGANGPYKGGAGSFNVFQGFQNGANSVAWLGVPIDAPGTSGTRVIRITNVRANACQLGTSSTLIPTQIVMYISVNGSQQVTINNPQQTVAFIQAGLNSSNSTANYVQCNNLNGNYISSSNSAGQTGAIRVLATEGFASSFKVRAYDRVNAAASSGTPSLQNVPGFSYNTESGYVSTATNLVSGGNGNGAVGLADTGTQIAFTISGIGAGTSLYVPTTINLAVSGSVSSSSPNGTASGGVATLVSGTSGTTTFTLNGTSTTNGNVTVSGTTATVVYEITASNVNVLETLPLYVSAAFVTNTGQNIPGIGQNTISVNFNPLSSNPSAATSSTAIPRFCQPYPARNFFAINTCSCNILFPFVTNQAGFDTGIAIANTSLDPFGTSTQAGIVTLNYYGNTTGGGAAPAAQKSQSVVAGNELVFTLSNGGNLGVAATPGFQGYIIATANFQYCHAFAFISDLGAQKLAEGYLGIILDAPGLNRTGQTGENYAH